jgi:hypothetical protein
MLQRTKGSEWYSRILLFIEIGMEVIAPTAQMSMLIYEKEIKDYFLHQIMPLL